ncbi:hypothetical protein RRG08_002490 [Elysia crispata]|uniref:Uncharacterized protein n=1 Tax=Elysia crispata TaxID=231223 RepID=A0AAE1A8A9_9GAST|nr:hypothetical protein RRG08_002490 [Elysia crispata]
MKDKESPKLSKKASSNQLLRTVSKLMVLDVKLKSKVHQKTASARSSLSKKKSGGKGDSADGKKGVTFSAETKPAEDCHEQEDDFLPTLDEEETEGGERSTDENQEDAGENLQGDEENGGDGEEKQETEGSDDKDKTAEEDDESKKGGKKGKKKGKSKKDKKEEARKRAAAKKEVDQPSGLTVAGVYCSPTKALNIERFAALRSYGMGSEVYVLIALLLREKQIENRWHYPPAEEAKLEPADKKFRMRLRKSGHLEASPHRQTLTDWRG